MKSSFIKLTLFFTVIFFLVVPAKADTFTAPYQIRWIMFRMLDFFGDTIDTSLPTSPSDSRQIPQPTPLPTPTPPALPSGSCPFSAVTYIRECVGADCAQSRPIAEFDNNQQYGAANDLQRRNKSDNPDVNFPFGHAGAPGEIHFATGDLQFPTVDGYHQGDPADIKVFLDANRDGTIDNDWQIVKKDCESFGGVVACPGGQAKTSSTALPIDEIFAITVECNVNVRYGWYLKKIPSTGSGQATPTAQPTSPAPSATSGQTAPTQSGPTNGPTASPTSAASDKTATIQRVISAISEQNIRTNLGNIVDKDENPGPDELQTRYSTFPGFQTESAYMKKQFDDVGLTTEFQDFTLSTGSTRNVIAHLPGSGPHKDEYYLVVAHLDSTSANTPGSGNDPAPGADDNGSGSVAVVEIARALKQAGIPLDYSVDFILFSGEEEGLKGSLHYVSGLGDKKIKGVINLDMIGWSKTPGRACVTFGYRNYDGGNVIADTIKQIADSQSIGLETRVGPSSIDASDHGAFWNRNITAIFGYECDLLTGGTVSNPTYHRVTDQTTAVNFDQLTKTAKAVAGTLVQLTK